LTILKNYYVLFSKHDFSLITAELKDTLLKEVGNLKFSDKYNLVTNYALLFVYMFKNRVLTNLTGFNHYHYCIIRFLDFTVQAGNLTISLLEKGTDVPKNISFIFKLYQYVLTIDSKLTLVTVLNNRSDEEFTRYRVSELKQLKEWIITLRGADYSGIDLELVNLIKYNLDRLDNFYN
jgi:hypothetical protein